MRNSPLFNALSSGGLQGAPVAPSMAPPATPGASPYAPGVSPLFAAMQKQAMPSLPPSAQVAQADPNGPSGAAQAEEAMRKAFGMAPKPPTQPAPPTTQGG